MHLSSSPSTAAAPRPPPPSMTADGDGSRPCRAGPANLYRDPDGRPRRHRGAPGASSAASPASTPPRAARRDRAQRRPCRRSAAAAQRQASPTAFAGFAARRLSSDGYTAFLGVFATAPVPCSRSAPAWSPTAARDGAAAALRSGWGFPVADRGSGAWLGLRLIGDYLDWLDGAAALPRITRFVAGGRRAGSAGGREAMLPGCATPARPQFATLAPAVIVAAAHDGDALATATPRRGCRAPDPPRSRARARARPRLLASPAASPRSTGRRSPPRSARPPSARDAAPSPLHGAWLVAAGTGRPNSPT